MVFVQELGLAAQFLPVELFAVVQCLKPPPFWKRSDGGLQAPQQTMASPQPLPPLGFSQEKVLHTVGAQPMWQTDCFYLLWFPKA